MSHLPHVLPICWDQATLKAFTVSVQGHWEGAVCYLMPRGLAVLWAGLALGWCWSFTVCQPGLGIATRLGLGGLGNAVAERTRKGGVAKKQWEEARITGKKSKVQGGDAAWQSVVFCWWRWAQIGRKGGGRHIFQAREGRGTKRQRTNKNLTDDNMIVTCRDSSDHVRIPKQQCKQTPQSETEKPSTKNRHHIADFKTSQGLVTRLLCRPGQVIGID